MSFYLLCIYHVPGTMWYIKVNPEAMLDMSALTEATPNQSSCRNKVYITEQLWYNTR